MATPLSASAATPRRARRNLTYREKLAIIQKKQEDPACTQRVLARWAKEQFRLETPPTQATISNLLRGKDKVLNTAVPPEFRAARRVRHPELDQQMILWVQQQLQGDVAVTRSSIQRRAAELAREMQLPEDLTFSKGWVSSFVSRHQLDLRRGDAAEQERHRQELLEATAEAVQAAVKRTEQVVDTMEQEEEEVEQEDAVEVDEEVEEDQAVEVEEEEEDAQEEEEEEVETAVVVEDTPPRHSVKRRRTTSGGGLWEAMGTGMTEEVRATTELLLDWIAVPGSYSRWWLLKSEDDKEPLCEEINLFLRSHGLRGMASMEIQRQLMAFVATFQAAHLWLRQARANYPLGRELTREQDGIKSHVLQMCPHYERLVAVLAPYANYDDHVGGLKQSKEPLTPPPAPAPPAEPSTPAKSNTQQEFLADNTSGDTYTYTTPKQSNKQQRQSTESSPVESVDDETKAQKRHLFELECKRLQSEIEMRNVQLVLEKTLARKKLLDAGISLDEVNRIFPL